MRHTGPFKGGIRPHAGVRSGGLSKIFEEQLYAQTLIEHSADPLTGAARGLPMESRENAAP